jgi:endonuclease/exonuclease/phosphatase (EEP) superfamily protein YafD
MLMKWIAITLGILGILLTVKPFIRSANWFIRIGDFPRLQILVLLAASFAGFIYNFNLLSVFEIVLAVVVIVCMIYQVRSVLPFTRFYPKELQDARESDHDSTNLSVLIFNVLMENREFGRVVELIKGVDADLVLLAETDQDWADGLTEIDGLYKHRIAHLLGNHYGMMLYSKLEIHDTEIEFVIQDDIPSIHTKVRLESGDDIAFHGLHPRPPVPEERGRSTERDGELLLVGKAVRDSDLPCIVAGDMNDVAWSYSTRLFKRISGLLDPRVGRGFYNTFHAGSKLLRLPLDHVFLSHHFRVVEMERIKPSCGSDHFPVFIKVSLEKCASAEQPRPIADEIEVDEAHQIVSGALRENRFGRASLRKLRDKILKLKQRISRRK